MTSIPRSCYLNYCRFLTFINVWLFVNTTYFHLHEAGHDDTYHYYYVQFIKPLNVKMRRTVKCLYVNVRRNGLTHRLYVINIVISYQINASGVFKYKSGTFRLCWWKFHLWRLPVTISLVVSIFVLIWNIIVTFFF